jgi:hypothetical protein
MLLPALISLLGAYLLTDDKKTYAKGGLLAPNGKPSNLTPEQYKLVRTPEFKAWFGDWENDPVNASKVVDENGDVIDNDDPLAELLIEMCDKELSK